MKLLNEIKNLKEQAQISRDKEYIGFANNFEAFLLSHKDMNVNRDSDDLEPIKNLFAPFISKDKKFDNYEKLDNDIMMIHLSFLTELETNHFINYREFYKNNFSLQAKMKRLDKKIEEEKYHIYKEIIEKNGTFENIGVNNVKKLVDYINAFELNHRDKQTFIKKIDEFNNDISTINNKDLNMNDIKSFVAKYEGKNYDETKNTESQNADKVAITSNVKDNINNKSDNEIKENDKLTEELNNELAKTFDLSDEITKIKQSVERLNKLKNQDEMVEPEIEPVNFEVQQAVISSQQMIDFIKDEKIIEFPFTRESSLGNTSFQISFTNKLKQMPNDEIRRMIELMRQKNAVLRQEISELSIEENQLEVELRNELVNNQKLTAYKEIIENKDDKSTRMDIDNVNVDKNASDENVVEKSKRLRR